MKHSEALKQWFDVEREKGLLDVKVFTKKTIGASTEDLCAELLEMINSKDCVEIVDL